MTQEEKQLLLKDLGARLPYGVIVDNPNPDGGAWDEVINIDTSAKTVTLLYNGRVFSIDNIKPYLRPMSSMTEEEKDELYTAMDWYGEIDETGNVYTKGQEKVYRETFYEYTDWLNVHHFDYRGLIEKGLALEAPEGMYKTE
jgi:hypothetical protein